MLRRYHSETSGGTGDSKAGCSCGQNPSSRAFFIQAGASLFYWAALVLGEPPHLGGLDHVRYSGPVKDISLVAVM